MDLGRPLNHGASALKVDLPVSRALQHKYEALVSAGEISEDPIQLDIVRRLDQLNTDLSQLRLATKKSSLGWLFKRNRQTPEHVQGLYLWGGVGRGKTMIMDLFMEVAVVRRKRRAHFHEFMADVHERIHAYRQALKRGEVKGDDPIAPVAAQLAEETRLLCFDEFSVNDIADAMILGRLFTQLFALGVVVVATSNVDPKDLYRDGLNRQLFLPFVELLQQNVDVVMLDSPTDYRLEKLAGAPIYISPLGGDAQERMNELWRKLTHGVKARPEELEAKGRKIPVAVAAAGAARFSFEELCARPLGAADYLRIAHAYGTVFLEDVPVMSKARRNEAKRFINLIDALYDNGIKLVISAEAEPTSLYVGEGGTESFEFDRTISRLIEMRSEAYLAGNVRQQNA
ncbi:cell division protein ZapE [Roseibium limicola]|uniref:AFG1 family ATPase n=1 Tax=Roseibium limicola TaxID=2816037 RepID=A0A939JA11_9HYPH|nr:cell division protein ZapE [Roseibium limicola]MBO0346464.1 AFG1 family ATPase [Roseibium limicola]